MSIVIGYQYKGTEEQKPVSPKKKASIFNRFPRKHVIIAVAITLFLVISGFMAYHLGGLALYNFQEAHRLDSLSDEKMAIDYVARQYLDGERNFAAPSEIIRLDFKIESDGNVWMSAWTDNACYYGPVQEYRWSRIELREP